MPDGAKTLLLILFIPFLLGLGHDIYFNYFSDEEKIKETKSLRVNPKEFSVSDAGWLWKEYSPASMKVVHDTMEPETWKKFINPILQLPTMVVGLIPWATTLAYLLFAQLAGFWPCANSPVLFRRKTKTEKFTAYKKDKTKVTKYKR